MLPELLKKKSFFFHLYKIDKQIAEQYRAMPCPFCGDRLYFANYFRKPRGEPDGFPKEYFKRFSLCCGNQDCRRRVIPPSCRFMGRKIYWFPVIISVVSDIQGSILETGKFDTSGYFDISRNTLTKWLNFFKNIFPLSAQWQSIRGQVSANVKNNELPASLLNHFLNAKSSIKDGLSACLKFLSKGFEIGVKIRAG